MGTWLRFMDNIREKNILVYNKNILPNNYKNE